MTLRSAVYLAATDYLNRALELAGSPPELTSVERSYYAKFSRCGVLVVNTRSVTSGHNAEREAARFLSFLKVLVEASSEQGARSVVLHTLGNPAKDFGDKLRSCVDTTKVTVTVRAAPHPAYIARKHSDLRSPECTLGKSFFCRGLYSVIMSARKAHDAAKEKERENLVRDLNELDTHGRKVASSYSEYIAMLESDASSDVLPKQVALQMLTTLSDSIIAMCSATRNVAAFIRFSSGGEGTSSRGYAHSTKEPATGSRVPPGDMKSVSTPSRPASTTTEAAKAMSPAEIRRARQRRSAAAGEAAPGPSPSVPAPSSSAAPPGTESVADTDSMAPPPTPTPATPSPAPVTPTRTAGSLRAQRLASRSKPTPPAPVQVGGVALGSKLGDTEASALAMMAEHMSTERDDTDAAASAEQLMASVESRTVQGACAADAVKAIRGDMRKDSKYDAGRYLGFGDGASVVTSNTYQFCVAYPNWTFTA
ncbi:hypothetical protein BBP40_012060 [Aspergillus hancockii]|nr:hypothetical protein BBP40_012060 [Aspergillus hancockii]